MNSILRGLIAAPIAIIAGINITSCAPAGTEILITNQSGTDLENVVLSGSGFHVEVERIEAGAIDHEVRVTPSGESGLSVSFTANGQRISAPAQGYFEPGGYRGIVLVRPDLSVSATFATSFWK